MRRWRGLVSHVGPVRLVAVVGGCYVALGVAAALRAWTSEGGAAVALVEFVLLAAPGAALLFGGYRLTDSGVTPELYPRVLGWTVGGLALMFGVVLLLAVNPQGNVDRPVRAVAIATALGSVAGLAIGTHEGRAFSRARLAERRRDELQRERTLREQIVETSPVGIVVVDADGTVSFANERAAAILGVTTEEMTGLPYDDPAFASDGRVDDSLVERILETGEPVYDEERQLTRGDGQSIWISANGAPITGTDGEISAVVFAFQDVTGRKRLEDEYERTIEQLRTSNERLEQFAHAASHDLQEPLRMVSTYLQLLENRYGDDLDDDAREYVSFAVGGADRMRSMIESLLEYSRVTTAAGPIEETDLGAVLDGVLDDMQPRLDRTDATITTEDLPTVPACADQLALVFRNLLSNAVTYSGDEPPEIRVDAERVGDAWQISVSDEGIGIDPSHHERIFDVFQRLHTDDAYPGTGVGLALCERIVERHGGEMDVSSAPGEGATFTFALPVDEGQHVTVSP